MIKISGTMKTMDGEKIIYYPDSILKIYLVTDLLPRMDIPIAKIYSQSQIYIGKCLMKREKPPFLVVFGTPSGTRTLDTLIKSQNDIGENLPKYLDLSKLL